MRSGFVAVVGRPNVGKSTLVNTIVGQKIAITTPVPQTTRHAVRGVLHGEDTQVVFLDTPGLHKPKTTLGTRLNEVARESLRDVDLVLFLVDGTAGVGAGDRFIATMLADVDTPVLAVFNKIDATGGAKQDLPQLQRLNELGDFAEVVPVSATTGKGLEQLVDLITARMPEGPPYFPEGQISDQEPEQLVAEIIREKVMVQMREEVPHSIAVEVEEMGPGESEGVTAVHATIFTERDSQKGIVIGKQGKGLADIGAQARRELELVLGSRVYLDLRVKLLKEWQRNPKYLERLGY